MTNSLQNNLDTQKRFLSMTNSQEGLSTKLKGRNIFLGFLANNFIKEKPSQKTQKWALCNKVLIIQDEPKLQKKL